MSIAEERAKATSTLRRVLTVADLQAGPRLTPRQIIYFYSPEIWEEFIEEWTMTLAPKYVKVERVGGANDKGVDVAAFASEQGYEGDWDCYQCKHYEKALTPNDARQEILKILRAVVEGHFKLPRRYRFVAPKGCGGSLSKLLNSPTKLREDLLKYLEDGKPLTAAIEPDLLVNIRAYATTVDFSIFNTVNLVDILEDLQGTPNYHARFGGALPERPEAEEPPDYPHPHEARYLEQLVEIHKENLGSAITCTDDALLHPESSGHIRRQRVAFYSAETLRVFARGNVPEGTFEALQNDIYDGVIDIHEGLFPRGYERLAAVLNAATQLHITSNALITVSNVIDRKGMCHQLANNDRLRWCRGQS